MSSGFDLAPGGGLIYLCTPIRPDLAGFVASCIKGGVNIVQLREKNAEAKEVIEAAKAVKRVCSDFAVPFILNDRIDLALEVEADGCHLGQDDAPISLARRILPKSSILGLSTHSPVELEKGNQTDADYLSVGPIVATPTKPGRPGTTIEYLQYAKKYSTKPFFVTGGVSPESIENLVFAGARGFVVVRYLTESADPEASAKSLRRSIDDAIAKQS
ncbi:MAG: thiamine phosphate synthase [Acidimicrobiaceae bacterium]|nr:thiamine phosphate synthase [Acidimicrobiaceae bacterium]